MDERANEVAASPGETAEAVILLRPGAGRRYDAGPMHAVFKADGAETDDRYCVSEWWLEAGQPGPGPHSHEANEELFYVLEGAMSFLVGAEWIEAPGAPSCASRPEGPTTSGTAAKRVPAC